MSRTVPVLLTFPPKLAETHFFEGKKRFRVLYGGRGGAKTQSIAKWLVFLGAQKPLRILCTRELMTSMADSCWQVLVDAISELQLDYAYEIEKDRIYGKNGTQFIFKGLKNNVSQIKSLARPDLCWVEEAEGVSKNSWETLIPTMRDGRSGEASEIYVSFNPRWEQDWTYQMFVVNPPPNSVIVKIDYWDNPWFPDVLTEAMEHSKATNEMDYRHIWCGETKQYLEGAVYAEEIRKAEEENRFCVVPHEPSLTVEAFWDMGDAVTAIWIGQRVGFEIHMIDYVESDRKSLDWCLMVLGNKGYAVDKHWIPWESRANQLGTGLSIEEMMRNKQKTVQIVPRLSIEDGINAVRSIFNSIWFDVNKCSHGVTHLRNYSYDIKFNKDPRRISLGNVPLHDAHSHAADALRYMALALRPPKMKNQNEDGMEGFGKYEAFARFMGQSSTSWMNL